MYFSSINYRLRTRINYLLLFNAPYIFNLSRFLKISLFGTIMFEHSILWSYLPLITFSCFPSPPADLPLNPLLLPCLLCVCVRTCRYRAIDHGF